MNIFMYLTSGRNLQSSEASTNSTVQERQLPAVQSTTEYTSLILMLLAGVVSAFASNWFIWRLSDTLTEINRTLAEIESRATSDSLSSIDIVGTTRFRVFVHYALWILLPPFGFANVYNFYDDSFVLYGRIIIR